MGKFGKFLAGVAIIVLVFYVLSIRPIPDKENLKYGVSFSKFHSDELELDWRETLRAILDNLGVRRIRFSAHWPMVEPEDGKFNFEELDYQMNEARKRGVSVILAVGRRLPGWPECHEPDWIKSEIRNSTAIPQPGKRNSVPNVAKPSTSKSETNPKFETENQKLKQEKLLRYVETVVNRYKSYDNILYWQVENEPFLGFFSRSLCGELDKEFLEKEIALVRRLDSKRQILLTASGEFDPWVGAYRRADVFGSTMFLYVWWKSGPIRYPITPAFFRIKQSLVELIYGKKPKIVIELSAEPWLRQPIVNAPLEVLLDRMGIDKFNEMIDFSSKTGFDTFYLWGAEWWYYMKTKQSHPEFWQRAQELFSK